MIISIKLKQQLLLLLLLLLQQVLFIFSCYYSSLGCYLFQHQQLQFLLVLLTSRLMWHYQLGCHRIYKEAQDLPHPHGLHLHCQDHAMLDTKFCLS